MIVVVVCWLGWLAGGGAGQEVWHNQWAVRVRGGPAAAARVAAGAGLQLAGNIGDLPHTYLLHAPRLTKRSEQPTQSDCFRKRLFVDDEQIRINSVFQISEISSVSGGNE